MSRGSLIFSQMRDWAEAAPPSRGRGRSQTSRKRETKGLFANRARIIVKKHFCRIGALIHPHVCFVTGESLGVWMVIIAVPAKRNALKSRGGIGKVRE